MNKGYYAGSIIITGSREYPSINYVSYAQSRNELEEDIWEICQLHEHFKVDLRDSGIHNVSLDRDWYMETIDAIERFAFRVNTYTHDMGEWYKSLEELHKDGYNRVLGLNGWTIEDHTFEWYMEKDGMKPNGELL